MKSISCNSIEQILATGATAIFVDRTNPDAPLVVALMPDDSPTLAVPAATAPAPETVPPATTTEVQEIQAAPKACPKCEGSGAFPIGSGVPCPACGGTGTAK